MGVKRPSLRHLQFLIPPDMTIGTGFNEVLTPFCLDGIDQDDSIVAFFHGPAALGDTGRVIAVVAHRWHVGDIDRGTWPRSFWRMLIHLWPCFGIGAE
jgi:hypothetical protein